jgi:hypothetical protein
MNVVVGPSKKQPDDVCDLCFGARVDSDHLYFCTPCQRAVNEACAKGARSKAVCPTGEDGCSHRPCVIKWAGIHWAKKAA